jgi:uncharacterized protein (DUF885 family)
MRLPLVRLFFVALLAAGCSKPTPNLPDAASETTRLNAWLDARYEEELDFSPMEKTYLGRKDDYDELDDVSESALDAQLAWRRGTVDELEHSFDYEQLTNEGKTSYDLWVYILERAEAERPFRRRQYLFHQFLRSPHTRLPEFLINMHRVDNAADAEAYVARIAESGRFLRQMLERAKLAAAEGVRPPRFAYEAVIEQSRAVITGEPFASGGAAANGTASGTPAYDGTSQPASPIWADFQAEVAKLAASGDIDAARADALRAAARTALATRLQPAYEELIAWVESDLPNTVEPATGVWRLPDGPAYYAERLAAGTTTALTADEIHDIGLREVARIHGEMEGIKKRVGFEGSLQEFFSFVRTNPNFFLPSTDEARETYLQMVRENLDFIEQRLPDYFGLLPKAKLEVRRVEAFREQAGAAQHYMPGAPDGSRPGVYYSHLIDMSAVPTTEAQVIAYHEGLPGHHMQVSIQQQLTGVPKFRTNFDVNAYIEGWGLYAELLSSEMGAYDDPYADFARLGSEIWRAVRLVVDTGLHAKGWTEQQAVDYFMENAPSSEAQIRSEIRRYLVWPGQATGYKIGMLEILELRERARAALGDRFDIRAFHDTVLSGGALPMSLLERRVDQWIAASTAN